MEFSEAVRRRRMVRSFAPTPLEPRLIDQLVEASLRAPSAGNTQGTAWLVLQGAETAPYWEATTTPEWRASSGRWAGLSRAPVVALCFASPEAYVARYGEPDKVASGLGPDGTTVVDQGVLIDPADDRGGGTDAWPVPYWWGDAAFGVMTLLLGATDAGLGACFLGAFRGDGQLGEALGVPVAWRLFGTVLLGRPDGRDHRSPSLDREGPDPGTRVHHGRWAGGGEAAGRPQ